MLNGLFNRGGGNYPDDEMRGAKGNIASVHDLVPVQRLFGNMAVLKDGSYRMVMKVGAVNFDLRGEREQMSILNTFGELLNTLQIDFPIQILLHAAYMDTEAYVKDYRDQLLDPNLSPAMRAVVEDHIEYFEEQAKANYLLDRSYFVTIPYHDREVIPQGDGGVAKEMPLGGMLSRLMDSSDREKTHDTQRRDMEKARIQLMNRCGLIAGQLSRLGISAHLLDELALMRLLRGMYNPASEHRNTVHHVDSGNFINTGARPTNRPRGMLEGGR